MANICPNNGYFMQIYNSLIFMSFMTEDSIKTHLQDFTSNKQESGPEGRGKARPTCGGKGKGLP